MQQKSSYQLWLYIDLTRRFLDVDPRAFVLGSFIKTLPGTKSGHSFPNRCSRVFDTSPIASVSISLVCMSDPRKPSMPFKRASLQVTVSSMSASSPLRRCALNCVSPVTWLSYSAIFSCCLLSNTSGFSSSWNWYGLSSIPRHPVGSSEGATPSVLSSAILESSNGDSSYTNGTFRGVCREMKCELYTLVRPKQLSFSTNYLALFDPEMNKEAHNQ